MLAEGEGLEEGPSIEDEHACDLTRLPMLALLLEEAPALPVLLEC